MRKVLLRFDKVEDELLFAVIVVVLVYRDRSDNSADEPYTYCQTDLCRHLFVQWLWT